MRNKILPFINMINEDKLKVRLDPGKEREIRYVESMDPKMLFSTIEIREETKEKAQIKQLLEGNMIMKCATARKFEKSLEDLKKFGRKNEKNMTIFERRKRTREEAFENDKEYLDAMKVLEREEEAERKKKEESEKKRLLMRNIIRRGMPK